MSAFESRVNIGVQITDDLESNHIREAATPLYPDDSRQSTEGEEGLALSAGGFPECTTPPVFRRGVFDGGPDCPNKRPATAAI